MIKIITALGNEKLNMELKKEIDFKIISNDIQYKEGIIEILEQNTEIDYIILNELLQGNIDLKELIFKINNLNNKIKIILFLDKYNSELEKYLLEKRLYKILYNNEINIFELINIIKNNNFENENLKEEINNLKKLILEKEEKNITKNKIVKKLPELFKRKLLNKNANMDNNYINNISKENINNNSNDYIYKNEKIISKKILNKNNNFIKNKCKVICITGPAGAGKSIISVNLAKINSLFKNKILIIDSDVINNSVSTIFSVKKPPQKTNSKNISNEINLYENIIQINKRIDLFICKNRIRNIEKNESFNLIINEENIKKLKEKYNYIIIDTNCNELLEYTKKILNISDINLFISDTNLLEINKSIKLLDKYINSFNIEINKFYIIFNKYNSESINKDLLKNIFSEFNIIGYLKYNKKYNKLINKNNKFNFSDKKIRKEYIELNRLINKK